MSELRSHMSECSPLRHQDNMLKHFQKAVLVFFSFIFKVNFTVECVSYALHFRTYLRFNAYLPFLERNSINFVSVVVCGVAAAEREGEEQETLQRDG